MRKLYVVTRSDLAAADQAVQCGHAVAQYFLNHWNNEPVWWNETLVYLVIADEDRLRMLEKKLHSRGLVVSRFTEPDMEDQLTAIACHTGGNYFDHLKKLGE